MLPFKFPSGWNAETAPAPRRTASRTSQPVCTAHSLGRRWLRSPQTKGFAALKHSLTRGLFYVSTGWLGDSVGPRRPARRLLRTERADPVVLTKQCQSQTKRELRRSCVAIPEPRHSPRPPPLPLSGPADRTTARIAALFVYFTSRE